MPITGKGVETGEMKRQTNSARFKAKVGLEALRDGMPVNRIVQEDRVQRWTHKLDRGTADVAQGHAQSRTRFFAETYGAGASGAFVGERIRAARECTPSCRQCATGTQTVRAGGRARLRSIREKNIESVTCAQCPGWHAACSKPSCIHDGAPMP